MLGKRLIKEFLFLTRGERRALVTVSIVMLCSMALRLSLGRWDRPTVVTDPDYLTFIERLREEVDSIALQNAAWEEHESYLYEKTKEKPLEELSLSIFDPNTISKDSLRHMHIPENVVTNLAKYREAGGTFRKNTDIKKIYGLSEELYDCLEGYIQIAKVEQVYLADSIYYGEAENAYDSLLINLNEADTTALWQLKGVGVSFAKRIVKYREMLGGYCRTEQLLEVYGMDSSRYVGIVPNVFIDSALLVKLDLNTADFRALISHPYISREMCYAIVQYRDYRGEIKSLDELEENQIIDRESFKKIGPYLEVKINKD